MTASAPDPQEWCPGGGVHSVLPRHAPMTMTDQCMTCAARWVAYQIEIGTIKQRWEPADA